MSIGIMRCGATVAIGDSGGCAAVFKIPDASAPRRTVRDFEARSAILVNASNIAIFSWGASNPTPLPRDTTPFISDRAGSTAASPLFLRAPVCTYVIEYVSRWLARSSTFYLHEPVPFFFLPRSPLFPFSRVLVPRVRWKYR